MGSRQPSGAGARMIAAHFEVQARGLLRIEAGDQQQPILEVRKRRGSPRQIVQRPRLLRRELVLQVHDAIRDLHEPQAYRPCGFG